MGRAISGLKFNKSPGAEGISPEVLNCGGAALTSELLKVFRLCWLWRCLPQDLKDANITPYTQTKVADKTVTTIETFLC